ncbi:GntR family transcriptional regulator [Novosphingobium ovatum]|uniref:GntR family transcriptional regulator n=1 Tax=Novosphingobium ovatum TaxID=1908523 RepID=UPI001D117E9A|nr:GntR family transcriptional regulator [Novosphingobium ovatum]
MVDRDAAVPLYHQIFLQLRDEILSGERPYGSALPTEQELAEMYSVSRITARRVLGDLALNHYVERKRRLGTRVTFRSPAKPIEANIDQAVDSLLALGQGTTVNVIEVATENPPHTVASALQLAAGQQVVRAVRVRCLDGEPLGYVVSYVSAELEGVVTQKTLVRAPILRLLDEAGFHAKHAEQTIGAILADTQLAEALDIEPRAAILRISRTVYDENDRPFLITHAHYRSDRFNIRMDLNVPRPV